jgi:hypothetical protein
VGLFDARGLCSGVCLNHRDQLSGIIPCCGLWRDGDAGTGRIKGPNLYIGAVWASCLSSIRYQKGCNVVSMKLAIQQALEFTHHSLCFCSHTCKSLLDTKSQHFAVLPRMRICELNILLSLRGPSIHLRIALLESYPGGFGNTLITAYNYMGLLLSKKGLWHRDLMSSQFSFLMWQQ